MAVKAGFEIQADPNRRYMYHRTWGYWREEEIDGFVAEMTQKLEIMRATNATWCCLADISAYPPQAARTQERRQELIAAAVRVGLVKVAYIVSNTLTRAQMDRLAKNSKATAEFFLDRGSAENWLFAEPLPPRP